MHLIVLERVTPLPRVWVTQISVSLPTHFTLGEKALWPWNMVIIEWIPYWLSLHIRGTPECRTYCYDNVPFDLSTSLEVTWGNELNLPQFSLYSETSLKGLSELRTQYKEPPY